MRSGEERVKKICFLVDEKWNQNNERVERVNERERSERKNKGKLYLSNNEIVE